MNKNGSPRCLRSLDLATATGILQFITASIGTGGAAVARVVSFLIVLLLIAWVLKLLLEYLGEITDLLRNKFLPLVSYNRQERAKAKGRRQLAERFAQRIEALSQLQDWNDSRYAELEAEVKTPDISGLPWLERLRLGSPLGGRRRSSLSRALSRSSQRLVVLEGDPGAGKTVAVRHVALKYARRAAKSRSYKSVLPVYANLRDLRRDAGEPIDADLIKRFALASCNPTDDTMIAEFLNKEFDRGISEGTWLFLFDSFDEIPELLSASEADDIVARYAQAISDFATRFNDCRIVLASREFKGPKVLTWPKFRVSALSEARIRLLMARAGLSEQQQQEVIVGIAAAPPGFQFVVGNPMFLGLLCDYVKEQKRFPVSLFDVFSQFVERRLELDQERISSFNASIDDVRECAEIIAFCMCDLDGLSLNPTLEKVYSAVASNSFFITEARLRALIGALATTKLARIEGKEELGDARTFTFAHRRLQEYFATVIVRSQPDRVPAQRLLTDGRWRETAVVLLQTAPAERLQPLFDVAEELLVKQQLTTLPTGEIWPLGSRSLLALLMDGLLGRAEIVPPSLQYRADRLIENAFGGGVVLDKKHAIEVVGITHEVLKVNLFREAFGGTSAVVRDAAYLQLGRLSRVPEGMAAVIRASLLRFSHSGRLRTERLKIYGSLYRLADSAAYVDLADLLRYRSIIDAVQLASMPLILFFAFGPREFHSVVLFVGLAVLLVRMGPATLQAWDMRVLSVNYNEFDRWDNDAHRSPRQRVLASLRGLLPAFCLLLAFIFAIEGEGWLIILTLLSTYVALLVLSVTRMASEGTFLQPWLWPIGVLAPIVRWIRIKSAGGSSGHSSIRTTLTELASNGVIVLVIIAVIVVSRYYNERDGRIPAPLMLLIWLGGGVLVAGAVLGVCFGIWGLVLRFIAACRHVREIVRARAIEKQWTTEITESALAAALGQLKHPAVAASLLRKVKNCGRLRASHPERALLRSLSYAGTRREQYVCGAVTIPQQILVDSVVQDELAELEHQVVARMGKES